MKILAKYFYTALLLTALISCGENVTKKEFCNEKGQQVVQEWYNDNQIKSTVTYFDKSGKNYISVLYDKNGRIIDSATYKNGVLDGLHKYYDAKSGLTHFENYKNGVPDGVMKAVFDNGITNFEGYMLNGSKVGQWIFHYKNGSPITYEFYDSLGNIKYFVKYGENGEFVKHSGSGIIDVSLKISKSDSAFFAESLITVATPPGCSTQLTIVKNGNIKVTDKYNITQNNLEFIFPVKETGIVNYKYNLNIKNKSTTESEEYSTEKSVNIPLKR